MNPEAALRPQTKIRIVSRPHTYEGVEGAHVFLNAPIGHEKQGKIFITIQALEWMFKYKFGTMNTGSGMGVDVSFFVPLEHADEVVNLAEKVLSSQWGRLAPVDVDRRAA